MPSAPIVGARHAVPLQCITEQCITEFLEHPPSSIDKTALIRVGLACSTWANESLCEGGF
ncbi:MAG: hypothetical protein WHS38_06560 [Thermodesulforhabdaceae bacterium]